MTEARGQMEPGVVAFDANLDVTEPMGMETLVYFAVNGTQVCGRVNPAAGAKDGAPLKMAADLNNMHLIDDATGAVL
jgi:multiple sugar transport system ATP-binding protein